MLTKSSSSRGKHEQYSREGRFGSAFWISVSKRWFCLRKISMNAALEELGNEDKAPCLRIQLQRQADSSLPAGRPHKPQSIARFWYFVLINWTSLTAVLIYMLIYTRENKKNCLKNPHRPRSWRNNISNSSISVVIILWSIFLTIMWVSLFI